MDTVLKRIRSFPIIVNRNKYKQWHHRQNNQINLNQIYGAPIKSSSGSKGILSLNKSQTMLRNEQGARPSKYLDSTNARSPYRYWETAESVVAVENSESSHGLPFKIVSYNILAQDLLLEHLQLYKCCNQIFLKWSYRLAKLSDEILAQRPDILCLQEVQESHLGDIIANIKKQLPMSCLFKKKTGFKSDGCAIFYNKDLFELVDSDIVEYNQPGFERLNRHNIALIAKLRCKSKPEVTFLVCVTHLLFNPRRQDVRLAQIMVLLAEIDRHSVVAGRSVSGELQRIPIILAGDFNFQPFSAPFELITTGNLCYARLSRNTLTESKSFNTLPTANHLISSQLGITDSCQHIDCLKSNYKDRTCRLQSSHTVLSNFENKPSSESCPELFSTGTLTHGLNFKSIYNHLGSQSFGSTYQEDWVTVDHLFYSKADQTNPHQASLEVVSVYQLPTVQQCYTIGYIPSAEFGSDHLMLASHLYLKFPVQKKTSSK